ncbi:MAG TPA: mechanosensitive ion channel [Nanoarchaeota archaeon]|nr:MAG: hypothetical protein QT01_C0007G0023 [archaeon GW2011_AR6]MBS3083114.1 mechanosensitive ion channel [Candidatus Pacearchaeota archaeon]HIH18090.1 mechanosensitive ion channel [Nanoarchaeota archaeon]HIH34019.1 mechanosensitive ion channel [Nanoarchaeota archaeon]HIH51041.1 mechanosensitive ion channel [Nanoarchaeota archaeon]
MAITFANVLVAIVILLVGLALGSLVGRFARRAIIALDIKKYFKFQIELIASRIAASIVYIISVLVALINLGLATPVLYTIIIVLLVLIGGAVFLVLKDFIPNVVAGAVLQRREIKKGDTIKFGNVSGKIEEFTITETRVRSGSDLIHIPNSLLWKSALSVKSKKSRKR